MRLLLLMALMLVAVALPAQAKILDIQHVTSKQGIKAWLVEDHSVPVIAVTFAFEGAGAALDPTDKQGLARMVSNTMDEGAGDLPSQDFQKALEDLSITLRFASSRDDFSGQLKTLSRHKDRAVELMALALTQPRFDEEPVARMRQANQSRIRSSLSDPKWIAARIQNDQLFAGHPYAQNSGGTLSSLETITPDDLRDFHKSYLARDNIKIAVAGDITAKELEKMLDQLFAGLPDHANIPKVKRSEITAPNRIIHYEMDIPQTIILMAQDGIDRHDPDYYAAQVMNFILGSSGFGSRLTKEIRENRGLTYGIYSSLAHFDDFSSLEVSTSTQNENAAEMLSLIKGEWIRMKETPITQQEVDDAVSYLIGSLPLALSSTDKIATLMLSLQMDNLGIDYLDQRDAKLRAITPEDISRVAGDLLREDAMTTVLVGQPAGIGADIELEALPNVE